MCNDLVSRTVVTLHCCQTGIIARRLHVFVLSVARGARGDDEPEGGRAQHDDLPVPVPQRQAEARRASQTEGEPRSRARLWARYALGFTSHPVGLQSTRFRDLA